MLDLNMSFSLTSKGRVFWVVVSQCNLDGL